jgi:hypothetical protein
MGRDRRVRAGRGSFSPWLLAWLWAGAVPVAAQSTSDGAREATIRVTAPAPVERPDGRLGFEVSPADGAVRVDGLLDEEAWSGATVIPLPWEVSPGQNVPAPVATECRLTYDVDNLYLGCLAHDPDPHEIRAYVVDRDRIDGHDQVTMTLDPFNDQRRAFRFAVSALGVQADAIVAQQGVGRPDQGPEGQLTDPSWDAIWNAAGRVFDDGYVVEAAVPFRSLRFPTTDGPGTWGIYLSRLRPRSSALETRSAPWDRDNGCLLCQANVVTGFEGIRPGGAFQLTPTLTASRSDVRADFPSGPLEPGTADAEAGLDAAWSITSDLTLNATVNPDFSQVEADVAQLAVNNRFALFFPEKRPFFLEGADFFGTPIQAVFTRSITDPIAGAKVSGKLGAQAVGLLVARDRINHVLIPGSQFSADADLEGGATTSVVRIRRDLGGSSTFGGLATSREGSGYHNRVAGVDAFWRPLPPLSVQFQMLRSDTEYPDAMALQHGQALGSFTGDALTARANWASRRWLFNGNYRRITPDFRADAGFLTQAGVRGGSANLVRRVLGDGDHWFEELRFTSGLWREDDFSGNPLNGGFWAGLVYRGPRQSSVGIWPNFAQKEHVGDQTFKGLELVYFNAGIQPSGTFGLELNGDFGDVVDYANVRKASEVRISPSVELRLGRNIEASVQHTLQRLTYDAGSVFTANLGQLRAVYNFSPRSFFRTVLQLRHTRRNADAYTATVDPRSTSLFAQLLYAYKVNPQTVLFLGYSEGRDGLTDPEGAHVPLIRTGRAFFLKLGWAMRP